MTTETRSLEDRQVACMQARIFINTARQHLDAAARNPLGASAHLAKAKELEEKAAAIIGADATKEELQNDQ